MCFTLCYVSIPYCLNDPTCFYPSTIANIYSKATFSDSQRWCNWTQLIALSSVVINTITSISGVLINGSMIIIVSKYKDLHRKPNILMSCPSTAVDLLVNVAAQPVTSKWIYEDNRVPHREGFSILSHHCYNGLVVAQRLQRVLVEALKLHLSREFLFVWQSSLSRVLP